MMFQMKIYDKINKKKGLLLKKQALTKQRIESSDRDHRVPHNEPHMSPLELYHFQRQSLQ